MHGPRAEHRRIIGARKKIDRKKSWRSDLKILRSHLKTLRSSWYVTRKWEGGTGDSKNVNSDTWTTTIPKGSSGELVAAENGPPECGCPDPLRNRSPTRQNLQISFHDRSLERFFVVLRPPLCFCSFRIKGGSKNNDIPWFLVTLRLWIGCGLG